MIKCELLVGGYAYDVTNDLMNWDDVEIKWKRDGYAGVVRSFSTKFEFCKGGYSLLVNEWLTNYLNASASIVVYMRNNSWLWDERFRCALDFSTFTFNDVTCEINAIDDSLASLIKAKKGTQYEYSVDVIKEDAMLKYDGLDMVSRCEWTIPTDEDEKLFDSISHKSLFMPLYMESSEIANSNTVVFGDSNFGNAENVKYEDIPYILQNISDNKGYVVNFKTRFSVWSLGNQACQIKIVGYGPTSDSPIVYYDSGLIESYNGKELDIDIDIPLAVGIKVSIIIEDPWYGNYFPSKFVRVIEKPKAVFYSRMEAVDVPVVRPVKLLNRLLKSMNGGNDGLTGTIASDSRLDHTVLVAAESIRGIKNAKLYTSYNKFVEWMSAEFGFVPVVGETSVHFVHRDSLFSDTVIKELENCTDFEFSVDSGRIYSRANVGYDKVDYESVNGKDEFRFTQQYTTGVTLSDSSFDLISPYRADAYGIEFLVAQRGEETTDSESDNDVFMVGVELKNGVYELDRSKSVEGVISPSTMFNVMYSQLDMIAANAHYIASFANLLTYSSSDGNSDVLIDGEPLKDDVNVDHPLFTVGKMRVSTDDLDIPSDLSGKVVFENRGRVYEGFVNEVTLNIGRGKSVTYDMIVKRVN